jgi:CubicO group peptidase (beta-lactamase class C family)
MTTVILIGIVLISLGAMVFVRGDPVSQMLEDIRKEHDLPALAAAVVVDGKIVVDDKFHLGSVTKSMTATVAAMLVEQGKISWMMTCHMKHWDG